MHNSRITTFVTVMLAVCLVVVGVAVVLTN